MAKTLPRGIETYRSNLREFHFLTPEMMAELTGDSLRTAQRNLNLLHGIKKVSRVRYLPPDAKFAHTWLYHHSEDPKDLHHFADISWFHIRLKTFCDTYSLTLVWQQNGMSGKFYPDAYFSIAYPDGSIFHFFLEIERQSYGNVRNGKPSIIRKADSYYDYYQSDDCKKRWGFDRFRVLFQLKEIEPGDFLQRLPKHRMYWVGTPDSLEYETPKGDVLTFSNL